MLTIVYVSFVAHARISHALRSNASHKAHVLRPALVTLALLPFPLSKTCLTMSPSSKYTQDGEAAKEVSPDGELPSNVLDPLNLTLLCLLIVRLPLILLLDRPLSSVLPLQGHSSILRYRRLSGRAEDLPKDCGYLHRALP